MFTDLILLTIIVCFIVDLSGIVDNIKRLPFRLLFRRVGHVYYSLKPFDCSLCMTWWSGLLYIFLCDSFTLQNVALVAICAFGAELVKESMIFVKDLVLCVYEYIISKVSDEETNR